MMFDKGFYKRQIEKIAAEQLPIFQRRMNKIIDCGNNLSLLEISYKDKKGNKTKRLVEPYKLTDSDFWGFDINKNEIRRFKVNNIKGIKTSKTKFNPRWDIEMIKAYTN